MGINASKGPHPGESGAVSRREETRLKNSALAGALFNSTQQRVLGLLFGQPDRSFFVNQIIELADAGRGAVQRELDRLAGSKLATVSRIGNQKHYQANHDAPFFHELCGIIQKTVGLEQPIRAALEPFADKIDKAFLFGSVAKCTDTAMSDIDVFLVADEVTLEAINAALIPVERSLARRIHPILYTLEEFQHQQKNQEGFLARVLKGPHSLLIGSADGI